MPLLYRFHANTSFRQAIFVHPSIEIRIGLTAAQVTVLGLSSEDEGHTLEARGSIAALRVVRDLTELTDAVVDAETILGLDAQDRFATLAEIAAELWPEA